MAEETANAAKPRIGLVLGDASGIGPEIVAKLLAEDDLSAMADVVLIADPKELQRGAEAAGIVLGTLDTVSAETPVRDTGAPVLLPFDLPDGPDIPLGAVSAAGGAYALATLRIALDLAMSQKIDAICFAPLNKSALHEAGMGFDDEMHWFADQLGYRGYFCELNVLEELWTSRVTSHVALKDVADLITEDRVLDSVRLIHGALKTAGVARPRIAVAAVNPHAGDGGAFGREEIDVLAPAIATAREEQMKVDGPFPSDTLFLKALGGEYEGVVTMYHDQGQIAMKLTGFDRGVSVQGGLPIPITTPAHGTAHDIAGTGKANVEAMRNAFRLACRMGATHRRGLARGGGA